MEIRFSRFRHLVKTGITEKMEYLISWVMKVGKKNSQSKVEFVGVHEKVSFKRGV